MEESTEETKSPVWNIDIPSFLVADKVAYRMAMVYRTLSAIQFELDMRSRAVLLAYARLQIANLTLASVWTPDSLRFDPDGANSDQRAYQALIDAKACLIPPVEGYSVRQASSEMACALLNYMKFCEECTSPNDKLLDTQIFVDMVSNKAFNYLHTK